MSEGVQQVIEKLRKAEIPTLGLMWQAADLLAQQAQELNECCVQNHKIADLATSERARADALAARVKELEEKLARVDGQTVVPPERATATSDRGDSMPFMIRNTGDDFETLRTIDAMEAAGATVVAITPTGRAKHDGALIDHVTFAVWARVRDDAHIDEVDKAIERELGADGEDSQ